MWIRGGLAIVTAGDGATGAAHVADVRGYVETRASVGDARIGRWLARRRDGGSAGPVVEDVPAARDQADRHQAAERGEEPPSSAGSAGWRRARTRRCLAHGRLILPPRIQPRPWPGQGPRKSWGWPGAGHRG